jgi:hypothetical protein
MPHAMVSPNDVDAINAVLEVVRVSFLMLSQGPSMSEINHVFRSSQQYRDGVLSAWVLRAVGPISAKD